jgi:SAM-dependent methyltransferase
MGTLLPHNEVQGARWGAGGREYDRISRQIADSIDHAVDRLDPRPGETILDLATGTGWTARRVAARGAKVIGCDIGAGVIEAARQIPHEGEITFEVADAESLPYADGQFAGLVSTCGIQFVTDPEAASAQVARVLRKGGRMVLTLWTHDSVIAQMFGIIKKYMPPAPDGKGPPSPFAWGRKERIEELLGGSFRLGFEQATSFYRDRDAAAAWEVFSTGYGPVKVLASKLDEEARRGFERDFIAFHEQFANDLGILVPRNYWLVRGERL